MNELLDYIKKEKIIGTPDTLIKERLLGIGWNYEDIENAFKEFNNTNNSIIGNQSDGMLISENNNISTNKVSKSIDQYLLTFFLSQFFILIFFLLLSGLFCFSGLSDSPNPYCNSIGKPLSTFLFYPIFSFSLIPFILFFNSIKEKNNKKVSFIFLSFLFSLIIPIYYFYTINLNTSTNILAFLNFIPDYAINFLLIIAPFIPILLFLIIKRLFKKYFNSINSNLNKGMLIIFIIIFVPLCIFAIRSFYSGFLESIAQGKQISVDKINSNYTHNPDNYSIIVDPNIKIEKDSIIVNSKIISNYTAGQNLNPSGHSIFFYGTSTSNLSYNCFADGFSVIGETQSISL